MILPAEWYPLGSLTSNPRARIGPKEHQAQLITGEEDRQNPGVAGAVHQEEDRPDHREEDRPDHRPAAGVRPGAVPFLDLPAGRPFRAP